MTKPPEWQPMDFGSVERRLTEARDLLLQAAKLLEARDLENVATLTDLHLDQENARNGNANGRRYR